MRVLILGPLESETYYGGVATAVEEMARAIQAEGQEVVVATTTKKYRPIADLTIHPPADRQGGYWNLYREQAALVRSGRFDFALAHLHAGFLLPLRHSRTIGGYYLHGYKGEYDPDRIGPVRYQPKNLLIGWLARQADLVFCNSALTQEIYRRLYQIPAAVVPLGVGGAARRPVAGEGTAAPPYILYVGKLTPNKRVDLLLQGFCFLINQEPFSHLRLSIVGSGPEEERLRAAADRLGIASQVEFHGRVDRVRLGEYYRQAACFVSLRAYEPFGLTFVEALVEGCPVVVPSSSGFASFFEPWMGALVERDPIPEQVAASLAATLQSSWPREEISRRVRETFAWRHTARKLISFVEAYRQTA